MKIAYIISTCDKYIETRVKYQMETMLKDVNKEDIYYLTSMPNIDKRQFGWYCMDDEQNIIWKYIHFIYNTNIPDYDWYILIHDDTFVFKNRLTNLLNNYNSNESYYIGKELNNSKKEYSLYMSGGAGYAISKALYSHIVNYVKKIGKDNAYYYIIDIKEQFCDDLCIGFWIQEIAKENKIYQINNDLFHTGLEENKSELETAITIHKVTTKEQYDLYYSIYDNKINNTDTTNKINNTDTTNKINNTDTTVVVLLTDTHYFKKAKNTIIDLRTRGKWNGEIVLITVDFDLNVKLIHLKVNLVNKYNLIVFLLLLKKINYLF
jgi:hypothetical protein